MPMKTQLQQDLKDAREHMKMLDKIPQEKNREIMELRDDVSDLEDMLEAERPRMYVMVKSVQYFSIAFGIVCAIWWLVK